MSEKAQHYFSSRKVRDMMKEKTVTQEQLAEACYVSVSTVSRWMLNKTYYPAGALPIIADLIGCEIMDFFVDDVEC